MPAIARVLNALSYLEAICARRKRIPAARTASTPVVDAQLDLAEWALRLDHGSNSARGLAS
jgi:hypothetical protein